MALPVQSYANHVRRPRTWSAAFLFAVIALALLLVEVVREPSAQGVALALLGVAVILAISAQRMVAVRLQDRIIRMEMRLRLSALGRTTELQRLTLGQLVALRFASDGELPALVERTLAENLTADAIKRAVRDWQADLVRV